MANNNNVVLRCTISLREQVQTTFKLINSNSSFYLWNCSELSNTFFRVKFVAFPVYPKRSLQRNIST